ncbi:MAG: hypothetical protein U0744_19160 [Gemmataceae bacterium]
MLRTRLFFLLCVSLATCQVGAAEPKIVVQPGKWGDASKEDITKVLESTAREFCRNFPVTLDPIEVSRGKGSPQVLFRRGPNREYLVQLDVEGTFWAQFAFQFAHELCHIQCRYREVRHPNHWFEETLCETASLYTLRRMAEAWRTKPPYGNWKSFAPKLADYAQKRIDEARLAEDATLAIWYELHERELRANGALRDLNLVAASGILPLFEKSPESWEAATWLNASPVEMDQTFADFLQRWHDRCPQKHHAFVRSIAAEFGIPLPEREKE